MIENKPTISKNHIDQARHYVNEAMNIADAIDFTNFNNKCYR